MTVKETAAQLRRLRKELGLTQKKLAQAAGLSQYQVGMIEIDGRPYTFGQIDKIAKALGLELKIYIKDPVTGETIGLDDEPQNRDH